MFAISALGAIATTPLLPITTKSIPLSIKVPSSPSPLTLQLPPCYDEATKVAKHSYDWFLDPEVAEASTDPTLPQIRSTVVKKAAQTHLIRGLAWSNDGAYLAVALESFTFLLYSVSQDDTGVKVELVTVIGFPRHLGHITMTPNGKNWLLVDALGDIYAFAHAKVVEGDQSQTQQQLYSVGTLCTQLSVLEYDGSQYLLTSDSEAKIRVSNLPAFFNIQSFCMGAQGSPTSVVQLQTLSPQTNQPTSSPFIITTAPTGYVRELIHDRSSAFCPYTPTETTIMVHNFITGDFALQPYKIDNASSALPFAPKDLTQYSAVVYYGLGAIFSPQSTPTCSITHLYTVPTLSSCELDERGHINPNAPFHIRVGLDQLLAITVSLPTTTTPDAVTTTNITRGVKVNNLPPWFNLDSDLIHHIYPTTDQTKFIIQTTTNKVLILTQPDHSDITTLSVVESFDFSGAVAELPSTQDYMGMMNTTQYAVSKYINFSWRFERAPTRKVAQKRGHMADALREAEHKIQEQRDPNDVVKLGREEKDE